MANSEGSSRSRVSEERGSTDAMIRGTDERPRTWFRSDRFFRSNDQWYFRTREGIDVGPFLTEFDAQIEASILKSLLRERPLDAGLVIRELLLEARTTSPDLVDFSGSVAQAGCL
jgi:hypothetical protein